MQRIDTLNNIAVYIGTDVYATDFLHYILIKSVYGAQYEKK